MDPKLSMILESENSYMTNEVTEQSIIINPKRNKKANKVRTSLLLQVDRESTFYLKNSTVMLNHELPKEIIKKYDQFEKKFDNPLIIGSIPRRSRFNTTSAAENKNVPTILASRMQLGNLNIEKENNKNENLKDILNYNEAGPLQFAQFLENKKISFAHKKIKISCKQIVRVKSIKRSLDNSSNFESNLNKSNLNNLSGNTKIMSFLTNLLNEEEKRKMKILEGYEKLKKTAKNLVSPNKKKRNNSMPRRADNTSVTFSKDNKVQYEELFELLEFKGINFKFKSSVIDVEHNNMILDKIKTEELKLVFNGNAYFKDRKDSYSDEKFNKKNNSSRSMNRYQEEDTLDPDKIEIKLSNSAKKSSKPPRDKGFDLKPIIPGYKLNFYDNTNNTGNTGNTRNTRYNSLNEANTTNDKFVYEKHPNSINSPNKNKINSKEKIDYDNYRNNLNTSTIHLKEEEDNSIVYSDNENVLNTSYTNSMVNSPSITQPIINLKRIETSGKEDFSSVSYINYTSVDAHDFISNTKETNFFNSGDFASSNYRTRFSQVSYAADNYEEYENNMNKLHQNPLRESFVNKFNSNYGTKYDNIIESNSNYNESESVTNNIITTENNDDISNSKAYSSGSNNSRITQSLSYITKSSGDFEI